MRLILCALPLAMLVIPACGQETAQEWVEEEANYTEAIQCYNKGIAHLLAVAACIALYKYSNRPKILYVIIIFN